MVLLGISEGAIGVKLSRTAIIDTLFESTAGMHFLEYYLYFKPNKVSEYYRDIKDGEWAELLTDLITAPFDPIDILDNDIFDYNEENYNQIEKGIQKLEDLSEFDFSWNDDNTLVGNFL